MQLTATVTKDDVVRIVESLTPLRIVIDEKKGRTVSLGRPEMIELVPNAGLRIRGDAHITWDIAGVSIPVTIQTWQVVLVPRIAIRANTRPVLAFEPVVEALDLKLVPGFLSDKIAKTLREGIAENRDRIVWELARSLSKRIALPARVVSARAFELIVTKGEVSVTDAELRLAVTFATRVEKRVENRVDSTVAAEPARQAAHGTSRARGVPIPLTPLRST